MSTTEPEAPGYPFTSFNFSVELTVAGGAPLCNAAFAECDGLELTQEVKTIREGGNNGVQVQLAGATVYGTLTLKRGMTLELRPLGLVRAVDRRHVGARGRDGRAARAGSRHRAGALGAARLPAAEAEGAAAEREGRHGRRRGAPGLVRGASPAAAGRRRGCLIPPPTSRRPSSASSTRTSRARSSRTPGARCSSTRSRSRSASRTSSCSRPGRATSAARRRGSSSAPGRRSSRSPSGSTSARRSRRTPTASTTCAS